MSGGRWENGTWYGPLVPVDRQALFAAAVEWFSAGASLLPVRLDGSKAPGGGDWKHAMAEPATGGNAARWFDPNRDDITDGLGVVCGAVSGHIEMLELEGRALQEGMLDTIDQLMADNGVAEPWALIRNGYVEESGGRGAHWFLRTEGPARGNLKLARRPSATQVTQAGRPVVETLIETRGEGGFVVVAPSAGRSRKDGGAWTRRIGSPATIPLITVEERDRIYAVLSLLDSTPPRADRLDSASAGAEHGQRPGDDFNSRADWGDILEPAGWKRLYRVGQTGWGWARPGKSTPGISATTGMAGGGSQDRLYVFSSSTDFPTEEPLTKFWVYAELHHRGDLTAAARALGERGYGSPRGASAETRAFFDQYENAEQPIRDPQSPASAASTKASRASLVTLAAEHFRIGLSSDERPFLVPRTGPHVALQAARAKRALAAVAHEQTGRTPGRTPLDEAWTVIEGQAYRLPRERLPLRVGEYGDSAVLDLCTPDGSAVVISPDGWRLAERSPVTFRRSQAVTALPMPERGGSIDELWQIVNVDPAQRHLFAAVLASMLLPAFPHPVVRIGGEQGSAKTTCTKVMAALVDPSSVAVIGPPKNEERWAAQTSSRWVLAVDNVSSIPDWWSDDLCRAVTGGGDLKRALYTDDGVVAVATKLCVVLNGISLSSAMRSDLAERLVTFDLRRPQHYLTEADVDATFSRIHAGVLGALLDLAVGILAAGREVAAPTDLRMADVAAVFARYDHHLGITHGGALATYREHVAEAFEEALDGDLVAQLVLRLMRETSGPVWEGTTQQLLDELEARRQVDAFLGGGGGYYWPRRASELGTVLPRSGPLLARHGVAIDKPRRTTGGKRVLRITRNGGDSDDQM